MDYVIINNNDSNVVRSCDLSYREDSRCFAVKYGMHTPEAKRNRGSLEKTSPSSRPSLTIYFLSPPPDACAIRTCPTNWKNRVFRRFHAGKSIFSDERLIPAGRYLHLIWWSVRVSSK